jgi:L-asparagine transporter-like permease
MGLMFSIATLILIFLLLVLTLWHYRKECRKDGVFDKKAFGNYSMIMILLGSAVFLVFYDLAIVYQDQMYSYRWPIILAILLFALYELKASDKKRH